MSETDAFQGGYPVLLDLAGRLCLVVGGGPVGWRKAQGLLAVGAMVRLVDPVANLAAQPGLDVGNRNPQLSGGKRCGERRGHVAHDDHHIGVPADHERLKALHDFCRLHGGTCRPHSQADVRFGDP